jgi:hypothetical protein
MNDEDKNSPKYFGSWSWNHLPLQPRKPISEQEAKKRKAYYVAHYDTRHLMRFEKYIDGKLDRTILYTYWENGKVRHRVIRPADGSETVDLFDRNGKRSTRGDEQGS